MRGRRGDWMCVVGGGGGAFFFFGGSPKEIFLGKILAAIHSRTAEHWSNLELGVTVFLSLGGSSHASRGPPGQYESMRDRWQQPTGSTRNLI